ncbi:MAG: tetratricopeptide repeat protein, partial [Gemmataceae bacterium]
MIPTDPLQQAIQVHQSGQVIQARELYRALLADNPQHAGAHHFLGMLEHQAGQDPQAALEHLQTAVNLDPGQGFYRINYANLLKDLRRPEDSERAYLRAAALQPNDPVAHYNLGHLYQLWSRIPDALACFARATDCDADFLPAWNKQAAMHLRLNQLPEAEAASRRALAIREDDPAGWFHLADCLARQKDWAGSRQALEKTLTLQPRFPEA